MPNVGPIDGWRSATTARLPMRCSAWARPTVVVVLPSPSGVGVIAVTTTYFAVGLVSWPVEDGEVDLRDVASPRLEVVGGDAEIGRDVDERTQGRRVRDVEVGGQGCAHTLIKLPRRPVHSGIAGRPR